jgi:hypothetical protein
MILESEIKKLKELVNKLIDSVSKDIDLLKHSTGKELIQNEKTLADILNKLVRLTIDLNKSSEDKSSSIFLCEEDEKIIEQFYQSYNLEKYDTERKQTSRSNIKK